MSDFSLWWPLLGLLLLFCLLLLWQLRRQQLAAVLAQAELAQQAQRLQELQAERQQWQERHEQQQLQLMRLNSRLKEYETLLHAERQHHAERLQQQQDAEARLGEQFENLANRLFEQTSVNFRQLNQGQLDLLLGPLQAQLEGFRRQLSETHAEESRQRHGLKFELERLAQLNQQMSAEAAALTRALKGDSKQQGNWGEVVLARILEESGLRAGHEYELQVAATSRDGQRYQPDVVVHLPDGKDIIIDAKVSLTAYERYFNAEDEASRALALKEHLASVRGHIRELGRKDYHQLPGLRSLDYVLLFIAVEPAFLVALDADPSLVKFALDNNILLVSPTNLMVALRTIDNLWRQERQHQNARVIAERAGRLYEKFRLYCEEMLALGGALGRAQDSYDKAMQRLAGGRGNLISQAEQLRALGVEVSKPLPERLREQADLSAVPEEEPGAPGLTEGPVAQQE
ncbi:MAG: DNA recombination protein RmuC [Aeromonadaceae bacterium]|nr:DNA recombination protein RmuC [Aeromonadaceae bacterium]